MINFKSAQEETKENVINEITAYWPLFLSVFIGGLLGNYLNLKIITLRENDFCQVPGGLDYNCGFFIMGPNRKFDDLVSIYHFLNVAGCLFERAPDILEMSVFGVGFNFKPKGMAFVTPLYQV